MADPKGPEFDPARGSPPVPQARRSSNKRKYVILAARRPAALDPPESLEARSQRLFGRSRRELIQEAAYLLSRSGRAERGPEADWIEAEARVDAMLRGADER